jgi:hypothetical protein
MKRWVSKGRDAAGGGVAGKSTVTNVVIEELSARHKGKVVTVSLDDFYLGLRTPEAAPSPPSPQTAPSLL